MRKANNMKYWEAEYEAKQFSQGWHTLQEWADYGFNKVVFNGEDYWDGKLNGYEDVDKHLADIVCELDYWDTDEDGYKVWYIRKAEK